MRFSITMRSAPGTAGVLSTVRETERPTIMAANSPSEVPGSAMPTTFPRRITVMSSATSRTSRSLCVMNTIARPSSRRDFITSISSSISCG
nr:hypothetical protein [Tessaracoccus coleopterorum]